MTMSMRTDESILNSPLEYKIERACVKLRACCWKERVTARLVITDQINVVFWLLKAASTKRWLRMRTLSSTLNLRHGRKCPSDEISRALSTMGKLVRITIE